MTTATATAPGRVNLIGEHTDYNGGLCLPFAIPLATTATVTARDDRAVTVLSREAGRWEGSLDEVRTRSVTGWAGYVAGVLWALGEAGWDVPGLDIEVASDVPLGGGLSSSASLEAAVATAVAGLLGHHLDPALRRDLAAACTRAETEYVAAPTGGMDQLAVMLAETDGAVLIDFAESPARATPVPLPLTGAGLTLLVTDTGVRHQLSDGDGGYAQRRRECAAGMESRVRHVTTESERVLGALTAVRAADWPALGALMTASHVSLRDDFEVSVPALDTAVEAAVEAGALGARLTGGGFGGCTIALVPEERAGAVRTAVDTAFAAAGHSAPTHLAVRPSAGARLLDR